MSYKVHTDPTCNSLALFDTFEAAVKAKGLDPKQVLRNAKARNAFHCRARVDRPKVFKGLYWSGVGSSRKSEALESFAAANDIAGYAATWRKLNNLKG